MQNRPLSIKILVTVTIMSLMVIFGWLIKESINNRKETKASVVTSQIVLPVEQQIPPPTGLQDLMCARRNDGVLICHNVYHPASSKDVECDPVYTPTSGDMVCHNKSEK